MGRLYYWRDTNLRLKLFHSSPQAIVSNTHSHTCSYYQGLQDEPRAPILFENTGAVTEAIAIATGALGGLQHSERQRARFRCVTKFFLVSFDVLPSLSYLYQRRSLLSRTFYAWIHSSMVPLILINACKVGIVSPP